MTSSYTMRTFWWGDGLTYAGTDIRLATAALLSGLGGPTGNPLGVASGVRAATGNPLLVSVSAGLSVTVNTGFAAIQGAAAANTGAYIVTLDSVQTLTCAAADPVNPRIDTVCITVTDGGTSASTVVLSIVTGTPASSPSAPSIPANSLALCNITVPAAATTLSSANLDDLRPFLASGIRVYGSSAVYPTTGAAGHYLHDASLGRLKCFDGTVVRPAKTVGFAPAQASVASVTASSSTPVTIASVTVTVDGFTNVRCSLVWAYVATSGTAAGNSGTMLCLRGTSQVGSGAVVTAQNTNGQIDGGSSFVIDTTPAAGTYTYSWTIANQGAGSFSPHSCTVYVEAQPA